MKALKMRSGSWGRLKSDYREFDLANVFEDNKKETWSKQLDEQVTTLSSNKPTLDEKKQIVYFSTNLKMEGLGDLYCLSVVYLGKSSMVSLKFFLPLQEKNNYLDVVSKIIDSFQYNKGFEYQN
jgi:hypothetical protein